MPRRPDRSTSLVSPPLARLGIRGEPVSIPAPVRAQGRRRTERPLLDQFIRTKTLTYAARSLAWDGSLNPNTLWYGAKTWSAPKDLPEAAIVGYRVELGPTNNGTTDSEFAGAELWGNSAGWGGAVVVGTDLPVTEGQWIGGPDVYGATIPASGSNNEYSSTGRDWWTFNYAAGALSDASPSVVYRSQQTTPLCVPLTNGTTVGVAVVFRKPSVTGGIGTGAAVVVPVRILVEIFLASSHSTIPWSD